MSRQSSESSRKSKKDLLQNKTLNEYKTELVRSDGVFPKSGARGVVIASLQNGRDK